MCDRFMSIAMSKRVCKLMMMEWWWRCFVDSFIHSLIHSRMDILIRTNVTLQPRSETTGIVVLAYDQDWVLVAVVNE